MRICDPFHKRKNHYGPEDCRDCCLMQPRLEVQGRWHHRRRQSYRNCSSQLTHLVTNGPVAGFAALFIILPLYTTTMATCAVYSIRDCVGLPLRSCFTWLTAQARRTLSLLRMHP